jgi:DNA-3-methyladenine glycosylase
MRSRPAVLGATAAAEAAFARPLPASFYDRPTEVVAVDLLGRSLVRQGAQGIRAARIVETEAYVAGDRANHACLGPTVRNRMMFGPPGTLYVYRIHQVHCANAVTGHGQAVLLRAAEPWAGLAEAPKGPGRLCRAFGIGRAENGSSLIHGPVRVAGEPGRGIRVLSGPRIGIRFDAGRRLRFAIADSPWISRPGRWSPAKGLA